MVHRVAVKRISTTMSAIHPPPHRRTQTITGESPTSGLSVKVDSVFVF